MSRQKQKFSEELIKSWFEVAKSGNKSTLDFDDFYGNELSMQELKSIIDEIEHQGYEPKNTRLDTTATKLFGDITLYVSFKKR